MNLIISQFEQQANQIVSKLKDDLKATRSGRAHSALVENLIVETYGGQSRLKLMELATILADSPTSLTITPFDVSTIPDIEKAIQKSPIGLSAAVSGNKLIIKIPPLSQEQRQKLIKVVGQKIEEKKVEIRNRRDDFRKKIKTSFEDKLISENEKFHLEKELDTLTQKIMQDIQVIREKKEQEILTL